MADQILNDIVFNYGILPKGVMKDSKLNIYAKAIYAYLCAYAGNKGSSFPGVDLIRHELGISKDTFYKYMKELKKIGYVEIKKERTNRGEFKRNVYHLKSYPCPKLPDTVSPDTVPPDTVRQDTKSNSFKSNSINNNSSTTGAAYIKFFNSNFGHLISQYERELLESYIHDGMEPEVITMALQEAVKNNVRTVRYVQSILNRWMQNKLTTVEAVNADRNNFKQKASKESRANAGAYKVL